MRAIHGALVVIALLAPLPSSADAQVASHRCEDYATQDEAQVAFDRDPDRLWELDDDGDGIACEHLPPASDDGASIFPWIAGGVLAIGAAAGVMLARRRSAHPEPALHPRLQPGTHPEYDPDVELELQLMEAERDADANGPPPDSVPLRKG